MDGAAARNALARWAPQVDVRPNPIDEGSEHFPGNDPGYAFLPHGAVPRAESLEDVRWRVGAFWDQEVVPELRAGRRVAVVAHENRRAHPPPPPPPSRTNWTRLVPPSVLTGHVSSHRSPCWSDGLREARRGLPRCMSIVELDGRCRAPPSLSHD